MQIQVKDLMTDQPSVVLNDATIDEAMQTLLRDEVADVYVIDQTGRLLGVVPDYELLKSRMAQTAGSESVETVMCRNMATIHSESPLNALIPAFRESSHRTVAVCDSGLLVGQIGRRDALRLVETLRAIDAENDISDAPVPAAEIPGPRFMQARQPMRSTR